MKLIIKCLLVSVAICSMHTNKAIKTVPLDEKALGSGESKVVYIAINSLMPEISFMTEGTARDKGYELVDHSYAQSLPDFMIPLLRQFRSKSKIIVIDNHLQDISYTSSLDRYFERQKERELFFWSGPEFPPVDAMQFVQDEINEKNIHYLKKYIQETLEAEGVVILGVFTAGLLQRSPEPILAMYNNFKEQYKNTIVLLTSAQESVAQKGIVVRGATALWWNNNKFDPKDDRIYRQRILLQIETLKNMAQLGPQARKVPAEDVRKKLEHELYTLIHHADQASEVFKPLLGPKTLQLEFRYGQEIIKITPEEIMNVNKRFACTQISLANTDQINAPKLELSTNLENYSDKPIELEQPTGLSYIFDFLNFSPYINTLRDSWKLPAEIFTPPFVAKLKQLNEDLTGIWGAVQR